MEVISVKIITLWLRRPLSLSLSIDLLQKPWTVSVCLLHSFQRTLLGNFLQSLSLHISSTNKLFFLQYIESQSHFSPIRKLTIWTQYCNHLIKCQNWGNSTCKLQLIVWHNHQKKRFLWHSIIFSWTILLYDVGRIWIHHIPKKRINYDKLPVHAIH